MKKSSKNKVLPNNWFDFDGLQLKASEARGGMIQKHRCRIKEGWFGAGREGYVMGEQTYVGQWWTPVLWDDEEDPDFHKTGGLVFDTVEPPSHWNLGFPAMAPNPLWKNKKA